MGPTDFSLADIYYKPTLVGACLGLEYNYR